MNSSAPSRPMTVGELSRRTGVSVKNLRQYTDDGLIYTMGRSSAGYRLFGTEALWCARRIGQLRGLGLTVAEIRQLIRAYRHRTECPPGPQLAASLRRSVTASRPVSPTCNAPWPASTSSRLRTSAN